MYGNLFSNAWLTKYLSYSNLFFSWCSSPIVCICIKRKERYNELLTFMVQASWLSRLVIGKWLGGAGFAVPWRPQLKGDRRDRFGCCIMWAWCRLMANTPIIKVYSYVERHIYIKMDFYIIIYHLSRHVWHNIILDNVWFSSCVQVCTANEQKDLQDTTTCCDEDTSLDWTINVSRSDCPSVDNLGCLDNSFSTISLDFSNMRRLRSNFQSMEQDLSSNKRYPLFLTETQLSVTTDSSSFSVPSYFLYPHFQSKAGCCAYVRNDITCSSAHNLESLELSIIWLRLQCHSLTKFICAVYLPPNSSDKVKFFDYLTSKVEYILSHFPNAEISILRNSNVHHQLLLLSSFTDQPGE